MYLLNNSKGINIIGIIQEGKHVNHSDYMLVGNLSNLDTGNSIIIGSLLAANLGVYVGDKKNITIGY